MAEVKYNIYDQIFFLVCNHLKITVVVFSFPWTQLFKGAVHSPGVQHDATEA